MIWVQYVSDVDGTDSTWHFAVKVVCRELVSGNVASLQAGSTLKRCGPSGAVPGSGPTYVILLAVLTWYNTIRYTVCLRAPKSWLPASLTCGTEPTKTELWRRNVRSRVRGGIAGEGKETVVQMGCEQGIKKWESCGWWEWWFNQGRRRDRQRTKWAIEIERLEWDWRRRVGSCTILFAALDVLR